MTRLTANGVPVEVTADATDRLSTVLREELRLPGTKVGCEVGDCGSCTVRLDGDVVASCLVTVGQAGGKEVLTVEGLADGSPHGPLLQEALLAYQAVQCGFCIPGMLMSASAFLDGLADDADVNEEDVREVLSGVLCRCTGYQRILDAVTAVAQRRALPDDPRSAPAGEGVGTPLRRLDGRPRVTGAERYGADGFPPGTLRLRAIRSPHHRAAFSFGDLDSYLEREGLHLVLTADDVPGRNLHGVAPAFADQPVFAVDEARFRGEAVAAVVGEPAVVDALDLASFPVAWRVLDPCLTPDASLDPAAPVLHADRPDNVLISARCVSGDVTAALEGAAHSVEGSFSTQFVEHAYLEPEAGWAVREGDRVSVYSCTQAPHAHRDDLARVLGLPVEHVRVVPTAVGGGFGGKLDLTTQPFVAIAAWFLDRPVGMVYTREESMATSTKRHPAQLWGRMGATASGRITGIDFTGTFNTGAYASWGTAVSTRVPISAAGPYVVPAYRSRTRAVHTHVVPAGAFRGFGVPQTLVGQEQLIDELAHTCGMDPLEFRVLNCLTDGDTTVTGQELPEGVGVKECLEALRPHWERLLHDVEEANAVPGRTRRGVGVAAFIYGCGNTAMPNPSTIRMGIRPDGKAVLHQGAVDAGQGSDTVIPQIAADALGVPVTDLVVIGADTDITPDCGRTSASRQTVVTGRAAAEAGRALRAALFKGHDLQDDARIELGSGRALLTDGFHTVEVSLLDLDTDENGYAVAAEETFNPLTTALDEDGQGVPYAVYSFGAQIAEVEVDRETGHVRVLQVLAAYDVGRAVNPTLLAGQIEGGVAQGVGMALVEDFVPGRTETFHDYEIPRSHQVPRVTSVFVESETPVGPYGAKGVGEPALVPTPAAVFNALADAVGERVRTCPATPEAVLAAVSRAGKGGR